MKLELTFHKSGNVNLARIVGCSVCLLPRNRANGITPVNPADMAKATHEQFGYRVANTFQTQRPFVPM